MPCLPANGAQNHHHNITLNSNTISKTTRFYSLLSADNSNQYEILTAKPWLTNLSSQLYQSRISPQIAIQWIEIDEKHNKLIYPLDSALTVVYRYPSTKNQTGRKVLLLLPG